MSPRTSEQRVATRARKVAERAAHRARVLAKYPPRVRYAKASFKKGGRGKNRGKTKVPKLGVQ